MGNDVYIWEMAQVFEKGINYDMYGKWSMYEGNCLNIWERAEICVKWLRSVGNDSNIWEIA